MNCLIENVDFKGKKRKKREKQVGVLYHGGINFSRELAYFIVGGLLTPCGH